jgi:hypothetical protein
LSDDHPSAITLEQIAERALTFQRYIFRRAWGTYYAVWAAAYVVFAFVWEVPFQSFIPAYLSWVLYGVLYGGVGFVAGIATMWIFKNARRTLSLQKVVGTYRPMQGRRYFQLWIWWVVFYVIIFLLFQFLPKEALAILFALLSSVEIFIYYGLKLSFQNKFPLDGKLALASYGTCIIVSFIASLFASQNFAYPVIGIAWGGLIVVWLFCALYALWRASEELVPLVY